MNTPPIRKLHPTNTTETDLIAYYFPALAHYQDDSRFTIEFDYDYYTGYEGVLNLFQNPSEFNGACVDITNTDTGAIYHVFLEKRGQIEVEINQEPTVTFYTMRCVDEMIQQEAAESA